MVEDKDLCLKLSPLSNEIAEATYKKKTDKLAITLKKSDAEKSWSSLTAKN